MKAYKDLGWIGGTVVGVLITALAAAQTAIVASKPIPQAAKGLFVKGGRGGTAVEVGEAGQDEIVLPMKSGVAAVADALIERLSSAANTVSETFARSRIPALAGAGAGAYGGAGNEIHWHVHAQNIIANNHGLKELERTLHDIRMSEATRKGGQ